jgi:predicted dehydrogenase
MGGNMPDQWTRRRALQQAAAITILPAGLARGYAANEKLNLGIIGLTGMGGVDAKTFASLGENIAALCDVDSTILEKRGAEYPKAARYTDFRKMIEKEKLDGVIVAVPDHNHAYISVYAMKHGLNVYCQKPLCKSVHEARVMARVAAETKVITQMGTQTSAEPRVLRTVELIQSGAIGDITEIHMTTDRPIWPQGCDRPDGEDPVPSTLDWDLWLGTAASRPFRAKWPDGHAVYSPERKRQFAARGSVYHPFVWRGWWDFGSGALGDIAPHSMNVIFLSLDLGAPSLVEVVDTSGMKKDMYPDWTILKFQWAARGPHPPLSVYWYDGALPLPKEMQAAQSTETAAAGGMPLRRGQGGMVWIGTKGSNPAGRGPFAGQNSELPTPPEREWGRQEVHKDWAVAVKAGVQAPCHFGYAGPFTEAYQLGNIALRVGHRIEWDPLSFRITNCREANQYLSREYRRGWDLKEIAGSA